MDVDPEFVGEVTAGPHVVVAEVPVHLQPPVHQLADAPQQTHGALGHHVSPFEPEVDEVADQVQAVSLAAHGIQPPQEFPLPLPRRGGVGGTEVEVGSEVEGHGQIRGVGRVPVRAGFPVGGHHGSVWSIRMAWGMLMP